MKFHRETSTKPNEKKHPAQRIGIGCTKEHQSSKRKTMVFGGRLGSLFFLLYRRLRLERPRVSVHPTNTAAPSRPVSQTLKIFSSQPARWTMEIPLLWLTRSSNTVPHFRSVGRRGHFVEVHSPPGRSGPGKLGNAEK